MIRKRFAEYAARSTAYLLLLIAMLVGCSYSASAQEVGSEGWQTFQPASAPMMVSPQTGQLVPAPSGNLPGIGDVPNFQSPLTTPQFQRPLEPTPAFTEPAPAAPGELFSTPALPPSSIPQPSNNRGQGNRGGGNSKISITPRDSKMSLNLRSFVSPDRPNERISLGVGGVRILIDSPQIANNTLFTGDKDRNLVILADSVVQYQSTLPDGSQQNELYLEGSVVFSKDRRVIYAERMFYNVERARGTILDAEILTPVADFRGLIRLKADVIRQIDANNIQAFNGAFTTSRLGVPSYWLQARQLDLTQQPVQASDPETGAKLFDPATGQPQIGQDYFVTATDNRVYVRDVPVFAWPRFTARLSDPGLYVTELGINNDSIFGTQVHAGFDLYKILGWKTPPPGTKWTGVLDYLSERGLGYGSEFDYSLPSLFGVPGQANGRYRSWYINDDGLDFLGQDRRDLVPEETFRGRTIAKHRQRFAPGYSLRAELGFISDRNFLEQFYERQWDTQKDATTGLWLERNIGTRSYNLIADAQLNGFFTQTSGVRFDQFTIGQPIFGDRALFYNHTQAGYAKLRVANEPEDPVDAATFDLLAWEQEAEGFRFTTRQEVEVPLQLGPTKVVPYALTDISYFQEALDNNDLFRVGGQVGVRASLPVWKVDPTVQSVLLNLNGLAHKVTYDLDAFYADASQDINELPLYDNIDDDSQEAFRRRFAFNTFGISAGEDTPLRFDERNFALRSALQGNVTSPSAEIFDDLSIIQVGVRQRWQTKRGAPGRERIVDLVNFDVQGAIYPNDDDNFGENFGMLNYDFRWHIGDRVSLVSDGFADFFNEGLRTIGVGVYAQRPEVGDVFVGFRSIEGPISSNVLTALATYRLSDKWGMKGGGQVDFGETGTIGQRLGIVYIGESFLLEFGFNYDASRDNLGFRFGFEPRFAPKPRLFRPGGVAIGPAGENYLE